MNQRPRAVIRDEAGFIVPRERWNDEQRRQAHAAIIEQFRHGIQRHTLEEVREEMAARWSYVESWEEEQAVREWIISQLDGLIELNKTGGANPAAGPGSPQFLEPIAARNR
ncbi:hypothetical protein [Arthrobacter sp. ISL-65]|uniref:hypothetical protein n=1 Tax=Arthrobacter sp. ISL-65 TaxID=2819112 RepID=UPI001BE9CC0F|nr:hypothetical protein [Arthrobacter sp. ISL-65]MBT2548044.1 hypothetical protein [Arthrobacter sp. ISL-65]